MPSSAAGEALDPLSLVLTVAVDLWDGIWQTPWLGLLLVALAGAACVRGARAVIHGLHRPDPVRRFSSTDKGEILRRAGNRCEYHHVLFGRCTQRDGLQADHVHPHSRGGWTAVANGQALCTRHNKSKSASVPWNWQLNRLAERRSGYFPKDATTLVTRHEPRASAR